jgi:6-phospho-beta-glucosidase
LAGYYYYAEKAVRSIQAESKTRGEEIVELNQRLIEQLEEIGVERNPEWALRTFFGYHRMHTWSLGVLRWQLFSV